MTNGTAKIEIEGKSYELPVIIGTENEKAVDIGTLRSSSGYITLDPAFGNTGSCESGITCIDGEVGILRYRGIPIEECAEKANFLEVAHLLIYGELPTQAELSEFQDMISETELLHESMLFHFEGFPATSHPMAILSSMINASSCFFPDLLATYDEGTFKHMSSRLLSQVRTIAAFSYRKMRGLPIIYPNPAYNYTANFLHMMFSMPHRDYEMHPEVVKALDLIFLLHADHEQNCSTSTVRMVASSKANLFASVAAGVCALWGPLHGGANQAVLEMLESIRASGDDGSKFLERVKNREEGVRLMGFGHRVYKNFDPRAKIIRQQCEDLLAALNKSDPLLDIAKKLEQTALEDEYFVERKLYPNVDFYSGIIMRAIGIPEEMFTVIFSIGRMPGWIAHYREITEDASTRISRPRQIYTGPTQRPFTPLAER
ncbi:MAG: citrate synthase [Verrucomicrobiales bacterium]